MVISRRDLVFRLGAACFASGNPVYRVHVFGLLNPERLTIGAVPGTRLELETAKETAVLEAHLSASLSASDVPVRVAGWNGGPVGFVLECPGKLRRSYFGTLQITARAQVLIPIVSMSRETAVESIAAAELPVSATPIAAMAAQAIVARSFLTAAGPRHSYCDFCDTTHCQFLRSPGLAGSLAAQAARVTSGVTLNSAGTVIPARYSAACGGHTDYHEELGYLYQSVTCDACRTNGYARRGHGLGLCQSGALYLARMGWHYDHILAKYYPATYLSG